MDNEVKVIFCVCQHEYQDKKYGKGNRLFIKNSQGNYSCTVCAKTHNSVATTKKKK